MAARYDPGSPIDLGEEGRQRVSAADLMSGTLDERKPVAIVNLAAGPDRLGENLQRNLAQTLPSKHRVEFIDAQLIGQAEDAFELDQQALIAGDLILEPPNERP